MPYPWHNGETLTADDLNAAIAGAATGQEGPSGPPGALIQTGHGPPTGDAPAGTTYFDLADGDVWTFAEAPIPPAAPYHAGAVNISATGSIALGTNSLVATNSAFWAVSFWQKLTSGNPAANLDMFTTDTDSNAPMATVRSANVAVGQIGFFLSDLNVDSFLDFRTSARDRTVWRHYLAAFDCGHVGTAMVAAVYVNDVLDTGAVKDADGPAFTNPGNGLAFSVRGSIRSDLADFRIMYGVSLLDGAGHIPDATRRLFIDAAGKPVAPAVATAALGVPCILFSGDASGFPINQGNGGAFPVRTGTLTNATTSPSD